MNTASLTILIWPLAAFGQDTGNRPHFDVASIKVNTPPTRVVYQTPTRTKDSGRVSYHNTGLAVLILEAYDVRTYQLGGLDLSAFPGYDVDATFPASTTPDDFRRMLQNLLAERFRLQVRRETRETPAYAVIVAPGGLKMTPVANTVDDEGKPLAARGMFGNPVSGARIRRGRSSVPMLVANLGANLDHPMVDLTGLAGMYTYDLSWDVEPSPVPSPDDAPVRGPRNEGSGGTLFAAMEKQLGLKVEAKKVPIEFIVVEHAEKIPREN